MKSMLRFSLALSPILYTGMALGADSWRVSQLEARVADLEGQVNHLISQGRGASQPQQVWTCESVGFGYSNIRTTAYSEAQARTDAHRACEKTDVFRRHWLECVKNISCRIGC